MVANVKKHRLLKVLKLIVHDGPSDNTAEDKSVQNPNESETSAASDQPSTSRKKKKKIF